MYPYKAITCYVTAVILFITMDRDPKKSQTLCTEPYILVLRDYGSISLKGVAT